jgi:serralysin
MATFTAYEQLFLELVNRARMNPLGEGKIFGPAGTDETPLPNTISGTARQVLAPNAFLNAAAEGHTNWMLSHDEFKHQGIGDGTPGSRIAAAHYGTLGTFDAGENIAWSGTTGSIQVTQQIIQHHENLFRSSGHRDNILNGAFQEIGIGSTVGLFTDSTRTWNALMSTQNFAVKNNGTFITGVSYRDNVTNDNFYSVGEAETGRSVKLMSGATVLASGSTWTAGGYALKTAATGAVEIVFSGGDLNGEKGAKFTLGDSNVKVDMVDSSTIDANVSVTLTRGSNNVHLLGINKINAAGNELANSLCGNSAANILKGNSGNDTLAGGKGADILDGGTGADKYYYGSSKQGGDTINSFDASDVFTFKGTKFGGLAPTHALSSSYFRTVHSGNSAGNTTHARFIFNDADETLWFDADGTGSSAPAKIAHFTHETALTVADIWIV